MVVIRLLPFLPLIAGCVIGSDKYPRPRDLPQANLVDRLRVLAIKAEPPEVRPGEPVAIEGLVVDPNTQAPLVVWLACESEDDSGVGFGCAVDLSSIDFETSTFDELIAAGVIGVEPGFSPTYTPSPNLLDDLAPEDREEGVYVTVQVTAIPGDLLTEPTDDAASFDFNEVEVAYKRLVVSEASTPNSNPKIVEFLVNGEAMAPGQIAAIPSDQTINLEAVFSTDSVETYSYTNSDGVVESRVEEPYITWYSDQGQFLSPYSLYPYLETSWRGTDDSEAQGTWWAVVRDRRGGMTWYEQPWVVSDD